MATKVKQEVAWWDINTKGCEVKITANFSDMLLNTINL
jgi:hypothetical protein